MYGGSRDEALCIIFFPQYQLTFSFTYTSLCEYFAVIDRKL